MPIPVDLRRSLTVIQASLVLSTVATRVGCSARCVQVVVMLDEAGESVYKINIETLAKLMGCCYNTALAGVQEGQRLGLIVGERKANGGLRLALAGVGLRDQVKRAESEARNSVLRAVLPKHKRKYVFKVLAK